jgi:hypothetical protein
VLQGLDDRFLDQLLAEIEVTEKADQRCGQLARLFSKNRG